MKVFSPYKYCLPGDKILPLGESVVGELPPGAKKHLDKLIAGGVVKVLDDGKVEATKLPPVTPSVPRTDALFTVPTADEPSALEPPRLPTTQLDEPFAGKGDDRRRPKKPE